MKLVGMLDSPFVRRSFITARMLGIPFEHQSLSVFRNFDEFHAINPLTKAPTLVLDDGEVLLRPGSVVVQRGTNHAWANRSGRVCRMLFVLVDGAYAPDIAAALAQRG